jgi:hypothetical protein
LRVAFAILILCVAAQLVRTTLREPPDADESPNPSRAAACPGDGLTSEDSP